MEGLEVRLARLRAQRPRVTSGIYGFAAEPPHVSMNWSIEGESAWNTDGDGGWLRASWSGSMRDQGRSSWDAYETRVSVVDTSKVFRLCRS